VSDLLSKMIAQQKAGFVPKDDWEFEYAHEYLDFRVWLKDNYPDGGEILAKFGKEHVEPVTLQEDEDA